MKQYKTLTLGEVIAELRALPEAAQVTDLDGDLHSYRGFYERSATAPDTMNWTAAALANHLEGQIGDPIYGWKGGEYAVSENEPLHVAPHGATGPAICGFEPVGDGVYEPVVITERW